MHYHESKVVGKCICNKKPVAGEVLEPDLRLLLTVLAFSVDKRQSPTLAFRIDLVRKNVTLKDQEQRALTHQLHHRHSNLRLDPREPKIGTFRP